jgi:biopolymer transport protein ExbB/TolQ
MSALKGLADAFHEGGWPMWPILLLMIVSWGIMIERIVYF